MSHSIRDSDDWRWYAERLEDPSLLEDAEDVGAPRECLLAVPVGGKRRGGEVDMENAREARDLVRYLRHFPGFPNPRSEGVYVYWGEPEPAFGSGPVAFGRYFGYSEAAIGEHMANLWDQEVAEQAMRS